MYVIVQGIFLVICCLYQCFYTLPNLGLSFPSKKIFLYKKLCIVIFHRRIIDFLFYCIFLTVPCGQIARDSNMYTCWRNIMTKVLSAKQPIHTVYPKKYAHGFVVLCFVVVMQSFIMNSHEVFIHIHQGCFAGTGAIVRLPQCQWSKSDGYGKISQCITTTKHSKAKTVCILLLLLLFYYLFRKTWMTTWYTHAVQVAILQKMIMINYKIDIHISIENTYSANISWDILWLSLIAGYHDIFNPYVPNSWHLINNIAFPHTFHLKFNIMH